MGARVGLQVYRAAPAPIGVVAPGGGTAPALLATLLMLARVLSATRFAWRSGQWAATNGQLRTFFESLLDEIAIELDPAAAGLPNSENRRQRLANLDPPVLRTDLNEWSGDGKNFVNGVLKRLHPDGPHPGLSDEEDSTFRLHLVVLISRLLLRRVT